MALDELISRLDEIDQGGPKARGPSGETSGDVMDLIVKEPGGPRLLVDRYAATNNRVTKNNLAFALSDLAESPQPETVNLIYEFLERVDNWDHSGMVNLSLLTIRTQTIYDLAWDPPEPTPPVLSKFLLHCLGLESDDENDNSATAVNVLWVVHQWASDRGGLPSVFNAGERQAFRDKFDEAGLDPGPILEALGKD